MIEMLGVLAVIGVLSAGGVWGYNLAMENYKVNKHFSDLKQMAINAQAIYNKPPRRNSNLNDTTKLYSMGILNENYAKNKSVWNTNVYTFISESAPCTQTTGSVFEALNTSFSANASCTFLYTSVYDVSEAVCRKLLTFDIEKFFAGFDVFVGAANYSPDIAYRRKPLTAEQAVNVCKGKKSSSSYIVWRIYWGAHRVD